MASAILAYNSWFDGMEAEFLAGLESRALCKIKRQRLLNGFYKQFTPSLRQTNDPRPHRGLNGRADEVRLRIGRS
jgi:hypothetical protein